MLMASPSQEQDLLSSFLTPCSSIWVGQCCSAELKGQLLTLTPIAGACSLLVWVPLVAAALLLLLSLIPTIRRFYRKHRTLAQPGIGVGSVWAAGGTQS